MSGSITFENILSVRVLEWIVILVGCKMVLDLKKVLVIMSYYDYFLNLSNECSYYQCLYNKPGARKFLLLDKEIKRKILCNTRIRCCFEDGCSLNN